MNRELGDQMATTYLLLGLAGVAAATGRQERAVYLLAAADTLREACGVAWTPIDLPDRARALAATRAALSEDAFARAWAAGQALSEDAAGAFALAGDGIGP